LKIGPRLSAALHVRRVNNGKPSAHPLRGDEIRALRGLLRHGCGYALANAGHDTRAIQDWLGHRSIQHTVRYTELAPTRFKDFWRD
jgi:site-specific recombinase XerC